VRERLSSHYSVRLLVCLSVRPGDIFAAKHGTDFGFSTNDSFGTLVVQTTVGWKDKTLDRDSNENGNFIDPNLTKLICPASEKDKNKKKREARKNHLLTGIWKKVATSMPRTLVVCQHPPHRVPWV
jgi:hypothetical protein